MTIAQSFASLFGLSRNVVSHHGSTWSSSSAVSCWSLLVLLTLMSHCSPTVLANNHRVDGRYSYSLTTFDPEGRLGQVDRAMQAAQLGTPILAVVLDEDNNNSDSSILLAAPQVLPSPLMLDDGTTRFARISSEIVVGHSGVSADGRVVVAAAQRLAVQHAYTYDEEIPLDIFLSELSLLFQQYTMKPATRPFGVALVVAHVPAAASQRAGGRQRNQRSSASPRLLRVDASGVITDLGKQAIIHGRMDSVRLRNALSELRKGPSSSDAADLPTHQRLALVLRTALHEQSERQRSNDESHGSNYTILSACLSSRNGFSLERLEGENSR